MHEPIAAGSTLEKSRNGLSLFRRSGSRPLLLAAMPVDMALFNFKTIEGKMMKITNLFVVVLLAVGAGLALAEQLPAGKWMQTSSSAGDCADCSITVTKVTPHIVQIASNNGWTGYAHYLAKEDRYVGVFEWKAGEGGDYKDVTFLVEMTYERQTLSFKAKSDPLSFSSTYRKK